MTTISTIGDAVNQLGMDKIKSIKFTFGMSICPICKSPFIKKGPNQTTCSRDCGWTMRKTLGGTIKCEICGKEFISVSSRNTTCSIKCLEIKRKKPHTSI